MRDTPRPTKPGDSYTFIEATPLYVGESKTMRVTFPRFKPWYCWLCRDQELWEEDFEDWGEFDDDLWWDPEDEKGWCFWCKEIDVVDIGGLVEPFAFGGPAPERGLGNQTTVGYFKTEMPKKPFGLDEMLAASSYVAGTVFTGIRIVNPYDFAINYWSPAKAEPKDIKMVLADGGSNLNPPLISVH